MSGEPGKEYAGGCMCGAVRYRISAEPIMARACWCRDCQPQQCQTERDDLDRLGALLGLYRPLPAPY